MYVVRLTVPDEHNDLKAFGHKPDAEKRFYGGWSKIDEYEDSAAALYEVPGVNDAREAVTAVKEARPDVRLLEVLPLQLNLDLSELGL